MTILEKLEKGFRGMLDTGQDRIDLTAVIAVIRMFKENEDLNEAENSALNISDVISCLSTEIESMHYQSRGRNQCYLQSLLTEAKGKGNLAMELIYALEKHLNK